MEAGAVGRAVGEVRVVKARNIPCNDLMPFVCEALSRGTHVRITATGSSMHPFIRDGDIVELAPTSSRGPAVGQVVFVRRADGTYLLHRVVAVRGDRFYLRGDAQKGKEGPFSKDQLVGFVASVQRGGKLIRLESLPWRLTALLWSNMGPLKPCLLRWASYTKRAGKRFKAWMARSFALGVVRLREVEKRADVR